MIFGQVDWDSVFGSLTVVGGIRVMIAATLGVILGLERQFANKDAGPRTYATVAAGSALFTVLSIEAFGAADPSRVAAQVVTGIGFLGAGLIFRQGMTVQGLTTAAGLWAVAAVGMASGTGSWPLAIVVTFIILAVLKVSDRFATQLRSQVLRKANWSVRVTVSDMAVIEDLRSIVVGIAPTVARPLPETGHWSIGRHKDKPTVTLMLDDEILEQIVPMLESHDGVSKIRISETT